MIAGKIIRSSEGELFERVNPNDFIPFRLSRSVVRLVSLLDLRV